MMRHRSSRTTPTFGRRTDAPDNGARLDAGETRSADTGLRGTPASDVLEWPERWPVLGPLFGIVIAVVAAGTAIAEGDWIAVTVFTVPAVLLGAVARRNRACAERLP
jgi:hypothetical protein